MIEAIDKVRQQISKLLVKIADLNRSLEKKDEEHALYVENIAIKIIERKDALEKNMEQGTNEVQEELNHLDVLLEELGVTALAAPLDKLADFIKIVGTQKEPKRGNGVVIKVTKKGYLRNDELLRPTHVVVVKND